MRHDEFLTLALEKAATTRGASKYSRKKMIQPFSARKHTT